MASTATTPASKDVSSFPRHRYQEIAEELRQQMRDGRLKPGDRLPSFEEMRAQGISQNTMEKVHALLAHDHLVVRRPRLGTFVARAHEQREQKRTGIIGLGSFGFSYVGASAYWSRLMQGMQEAASEQKMQILLLDPYSSQGWEKADGVLLASWAAEAPAWMPENTPCVSVMVPVEGMASVVADDLAAMRAATERLISLGHRRIAVLNGGTAPTTAQPNGSYSVVIERRLQGYREALASTSILPDPRWEHSFRGPYYYGASFSDRGRETMTAWLQNDWKELGCTAILAHNDEVALGVIQALQSGGLRVPEDVSVVGFDGTEICDIARPRLASVELPLVQIGKAAMETLIREIKSGEKTTEHQVFSSHFKEGDSVSPRV